MSSVAIQSTQVWANRTVRTVALALAGSAFIAISARVQAPMYPAPMTLQTYAVLLIAMAFGPRLGCLTIAAYLLEGFVGLPVFASGGGPAYILGPTAGYLVGFMLATWIVGAIVHSGVRHAGALFLTALLGTAVILASGAVWQGVLGGPAAAWTAISPYLLGGVVKSGMVAASYVIGRRLLTTTTKDDDPAAA